MATLALIGLGSNLGDRAGHLDRAVAALAELPDSTIRAVSSYLKTSPAGGPEGQGPFLNAAVALRTYAGPLQLLRALQEIETRFGRVREERWGERTLDLDLILFGDRVIETPELTVPHPRMAVRRFALAPAAEVAPAMIDPLTGRSVSALLANLDRRPSLVALAGFPSEQQAELFSRLVVGLGAVGLGELGQHPWGSRSEDPHEIELQFERLVAGWDAVHCLAGSRPDRWLVTDLWFDELYFQARSVLGAPRWLEFRARFLEARKRILAPTFVVSLRGSVAYLQRSTSARDRQFSPPTDTPILEFGKVSPSEMIDVGGDGMIGQRLRTLSVDLDAIEADVLAACAASRPS